jgi:probable HAF family extracellular repeat protein
MHLAALEPRLMLASYTIELIQPAAGTGIGQREGGVAIDQLFVAGNLSYQRDLRSYVAGGPDEVTTILKPLRGDDTTDARATNKLGQVAGISYDSAQAPPELRAVLWNPITGKPSDLGAGTPAAVNDNGVVVGTYDERAVRFTSSGAKPIPALGGSASAANDVNNRNQVVGTSLVEDDSRLAAFIYDGRRAVDIAPGYPSAVGLAINDQAWAVGQVQDTRAFVYHDGVTELLPPVSTLRGAQTSIALDINNRNEVVGASRTDAVSRATLWSDGKPVDLNTLLAGKRNEVALHTAVSISDRGEILAHGAQDGQPATFVLTPQRAVLSAKGSLSVYATHGDDSVSLANKGKKVRVTVNDLTQSFTRSKVKRILVVSYDGNDRISIGPKLGDSSIDAGEGDDVVTGGDGDDSLHGGPGRDKLTGGKGNDSISGAAGADTLDGSNGQDRADNDPSDVRQSIEFLAGVPMVNTVSSKPPATLAASLVKMLGLASA